MAEDPKKRAQEIQAKYGIPDIDFGPGAIGLDEVAPEVLGEEFLPQTEESKQFETDWQKKGIGEKVQSGWQKGKTSLKSGLQGLAAEVLPKFSTITGIDMAVHNQMNRDNPALTDNEAFMLEMAEPIKQKAIANKTKSDAIQGKGVVFEAATFLPQMAGTFGALAAAPLTGGTSLAAIPGIIGTANIAMLTGSVVGNTLLEVDQYKEETGKDISDFTKWSVALLAGTAEYAAERIRLPRILPKGLTGKMLSSFMKETPEVAEDLMRGWAKNNPSMYRKSLELAKTVLQQGVEEGTEEFFTQVAQDYTNYLYQNPEDRFDLEQILTNAANAFKGGMMMGNFIGPMSYASNDLTTAMRRSKNGGITLVQDKNNKTYELVGFEGDKAWVQDNLMKQKAINASDIEDRISISKDDMNEYLDAYQNSQELLPQLEKRIKDKDAENTIRQQGQKYIFPGTQRNPSIKFAQTEDGRQVILTNWDEWDNIEDAIYTAVDANDPEGKPFMLKRAQIREEMEVPYEDWVQNELNQYHGVVAQGEKIVQQSQSPFQRGQQIDYQGKKWAVSDFGDNGSLVVDEITKDGMGASTEIPQDQFNNIVGYQGNAQPSATSADSDQSSANTSTGPLNVSQEVSDQYNAEQAQKPQARKISDGKNEFTVSPTQDGSFTVDKVFEVEEEATSLAKKLQKRYPKLNFAVNVKDNNDPFVTDEYTITATIKAPAAKEASPVPDETVTAKTDEQVSGESQGKAGPMVNSDQAAQPEMVNSDQTRQKPIPQNIVDRIGDMARVESGLSQEQRNTLIDAYSGIQRAESIEQQYEIFDALMEDHEIANMIANPDMVNSDQNSGQNSPKEEEKSSEEQTQVDLTAANDQVEANPTEAQKKAGNYQKGHVTIQGLDITIENPAGSIRKGTDEDGKDWAIMLNNSYGYFKRTRGKDGDQIDVFLGDKLNARNAFVVDQVNPETGEFDEHKVMLGFSSEQEARDAYLANYEPGWKGLGAITKMSIPELKEWKGTGKRVNKPAAKSLQDKDPIRKPKVQSLNKLLDKDGIITAIERYNEMTTAQQQKNALLANDIQFNAQRLGFELIRDGRNFKLLKDGNPVKRDAYKTDKRVIEDQKLLTEYSEDFQQFVNDVLLTNPNLFGVMIGGLSNDQRAQAARDIAVGKKSVATLRTLDSLETMFNAGGVDIWDNVSKTTIGVSYEEIKAQRDDILARQGGDLLNNYSYLDADVLLAKGLITQQEYETIVDYAVSEFTEQSRLEKDFYAERFGDNKSSQEESGRTQTTEKRTGEPTGGQPEVSKPEETKGQEYRYKMTLRPFDIGTYPKEGFVRAENDPAGGYQVLIYNRKLSSQERKHYSFLPITEIEDLKGKQFSDKDGEFFVDLEWMGNNIGADISMFNNKNELIEKPYFMSTNDILKNIEDGYWIEKREEVSQDQPWKAKGPFIYTKERYPYLSDEELTKLNDIKQKPGSHTREEIDTIFKKIEVFEAASRTKYTGGITVKDWVDKKLAEGYRLRGNKFSDGLREFQFGPIHKLAKEYAGYAQELLPKETEQTKPKDDIDKINDILDSKPKKKDLTEEINIAGKLGKEAFNAGKTRVPAQDQKLLNLLKGLQVGESDPLLKAWLKAWDKANLAAAPDLEGTPAYSNGKLISKKNTSIGFEYNVKYKISSGAYEAVFYSGNDNLTIPTSFRNEAEIEAFRKTLANESPVTPKVKPSNFGKSNTITTESAKDAALRRIRERRNNLNSGIDPSDMLDAAIVTNYYVEGGVRKFADIAKKLIEDIGEWIRPYTKIIYNIVRDNPDMAQFKPEMDHYDYVDKFDLTTIENINNFDLETPNSQEDVSDRTRDSQPDSQDNSDDVSGDETAVPDERGGSGSLGNEPTKRNRSRGRKGSSQGGSGLFGPLFGEQGDNEIHQQDEESGIEDDDAGDFDGRGSSTDGTNGSDVSDQPTDEDDSRSDERVSNSFKEKTRLRKIAQQKAEPIQVKIMDEANIRETLPVLLPEQQDDVLKAEKRFFGQQQQIKELAFGKGMLFTNGTGTGKTFTGLGIIKRFVKQGKSDILIVVPSEAKIKDWIEDGENLGLHITALKNTQDKGKGICITTYATFRANDNLKNRDMDLVVYDESHRLMEEKNGRTSATTNAHYQMSNTSQFHAFDRISSVHPLWIERRSLNEALRSNRISTNNLDLMDWQLAELREKIKKQEDRLEQIEEQISEVTPSLEERAKKAYEKTKVVFLSATPFKGHFNLRYANGSLFDWGNETTYESASRGMSRVDPESRFFLDNFGSAYEWKYHRLQSKQNANAEAIAMQEVAFAEKLMSQGVMSGRAIESDMDYSREFPLVSLDKSEIINKAFNDLFSFSQDRQFEGLAGAAHAVFYNYNYTTQLFESLRASMTIPRIEKHIALGRKVVVFHRRKQANVEPPFALILRTTRINAGAVLKDPDASQKEKDKAQEALQQADLFEEKYQELLEYEKTLNYTPAIDQIINKFGNDKVVLLNGDTPKRDKSLNIQKFNDDNSGVNILVVQEEAGKEGISLHDITGKAQRVILNMSLPISSTTALQIEGRIFRIGQESNAIFEYPIMGLDMEIADFGQRINRKLSTTENLAIGNQSRDLLRSFAEGVLFNSKTDDPNTDQGQGGKEYDRKAQVALSEFRKSVLVYSSNQKKRGKRDQREGLDYFATPEPLGQKMVQWLDLREGNTALEPSAGHGAIAMWFPESASITAIEPSYTLFAKLNARAAGGNRKIVNSTFEDFDIINKFDGIAMNPPFGTGGKMAMDHIEKAFKHLRNGGRIVAIIPDGGSMNKRFEEFLHGTDKDGKLLNPDAHLVATIKLPRVTFEQAGTQVSSRVVIIDKIVMRSRVQIENGVRNENVAKLLERGGIIKTEDEIRAEVDRRYALQYDSIPQQMTMELPDVKNISEFFDAIEYIEVPARSIKEKDVPSSSSSETPDIKGDPNYTKTDTPYKLVNTKHTQTGQDLHYVKLTDRVDSETYKQISELAKKYGGFWDKYAKSFRFNDKDQRQKFVDEAFNKPSDDVSLLNEKAETYIKEKGVYSQARPKEDFPEGVSYVSERAKLDLPGQYNLFGQEDNITPTVNSDVTYSERVLSELKSYTLLGDKLTGAAKIKSANDVAFLFKNLEDAGTENVFAVFIDKNNKYKVLYVSSGGIAGSVIDPKVVVAAAKEFGAKKVYFVHNHPSGNLQPSPADYRIYNKLKEALAGLDIKLQKSVIINLDSGFYGVFTDENDTDYASLNKEEYSSKNELITPKVYQFDRQKLYIPSSEFTKIISSSDVAEYLSKMKRGTTPKLHAIILNRANRITKYLLYDENISKDDLARELLYEISKHGSGVILASNTDLDRKFVSHVKNIINHADAEVLDVLTIKQSDDIINNYKSFADHGLLEPKAQYGDSVKEGDVQFRASESEQPLSAEIEDLKKRIKATVKARDAKKNELANRLATQSDLFGGAPTGPTITQASMFDIKQDDSVDNIKRILSDYDNTLAGMRDMLGKLEAAYITASKENAGLQTLFRISDALYFSPVEKALEAIKQNKATPQQWKAMLLKNGAKQAELEWMGFDDFFMIEGGIQSWTKDEIQEWIDKNKVNIKEVSFGGLSDEQIRERKKAIEQKFEEEGYKIQTWFDDLVIETAEGEPLSDDQLDELPEHLARAGREYSSLSGLYDVEDRGTKYSKYVMPGGEDYKELLLTMPVIPANDKLISKAEARKLFNEGGVVYGVSGNGHTDLIETEEDLKGYRYFSEQADRVDKKIINEVRSKDVFQTNHWDEDNVLAHVRFNTRTTTDGKSVLFIEEVQSDWAQKGKKEGYKSELDKLYSDLEKKGIYKDRNSSLETSFVDSEGFQIYHPNTNVEQKATPEQDKALDEFFLTYGKLANASVPDMPFKQTDQWADLVLRRMIRYAIDNGFDSIAWTPGQVQADRYDLSKYIDSIEYSKNGNGTYNLFVTDKDGNEILDRLDIPEKQLEEIVGKDVAIRITKGEGQDNIPDSYNDIIKRGRAIESYQNGNNWYVRFETGKTMGYWVFKADADNFINTINQDYFSGKGHAPKILSGLDLKVGGSGMIAFYDQILPSIANKIGKRFGTKVTEGQIDIGEAENDISEYDTEDQMVWPDADVKMQPVHTLPISQAMFENYRQGVPLYRNYETKQEGEALVESIVGDKDDIRIEREMRGRIEILSNKLKTPIITVNKRSQLPDRIQRQIKKSGLEKRRITGIWDNQTESVYIILDEVNFISEITKIVLHEVVAHKGLKALLGDTYGKVMADIYDSMTPEEISRLEYLYNTKNSTTIAEEYLGHMAENGIEPDLFQRIIAKIRQILRRMFKINYSPDDIHALLRQSRINLENQSKPKGSDYETAGEYLDALTAWHGSPYGKIRKFSTKYVGKGEGSQLFGYGLYFTDMKEVAEYYAKSNANLQRYLDKVKADLGERASMWIDKALLRNKWDYQAATKYLEERREKYSQNPNLYNRFNRILEYISQHPLPRNRYLYQVLLSKEKGLTQLDWMNANKPLSNAQTVKVADQLKKEGVNDALLELALWDITPAGKIYELLTRALGTNKEASMFLSRAGIDGMKYPITALQSQIGSVKEHKGPEVNYVVFNDQDVSISGRYSFRMKGEDDPDPDPTNSPIFKKWFRKSKVVDKNGKPLKVYHGARVGDYEDSERFNEFDGLEAIGWFAEDKTKAQDYNMNGWMYEVYLSIQKPFELSGDMQDEITQAEFEERIGFKLNNNSYTQSKNYNPDEKMEMWEYVQQTLTSFQYQLLDKGYDGIKVKEKGHVTWGVIKDPAQIKLATGNNGNYSINDPDIRFRASVQSQPAPSGPPINILQTKGEKRTELWQNRMLSVKEWQNRIKGKGGKITEISNPYRQENLSHSIVKRHIEDFDAKHLDSLEKAASELMIKAGIDYEQLNEYMQAKHAPERNRELGLQKMAQELKITYDEMKRLYEAGNLVPDIKDAIDNSVNSGMTTADAEKLIASYEAKMTPQLVDNFWKAINQSTAFTVDRWLADGFIGIETYIKIKNQYEYYVPLRNWKKTDADALYEYQENDIGKTVNPLKRAKGRKSLADDPMQYIVNMAHTAIVMGEKNRIKQHAARLVRDNKDMEDLHKFKKVYAVWDGTIDPASGEKNYVEVLDRPTQDLWDNDMVKTKFSMGHVKGRPMSQAAQHEVDVFIGGDKYSMVLPADVATALNKTPSKWDNIAYLLRDMKLGIFTRWLSSNFTSKNPAFILMNQMRDLQYATLAHLIKGDTKEAVRFVTILPKARKAIIQHQKGTGNVKDPAYQMYLDFLRSGGETGYVHLKDVDQLASEIKRDLARLTGTNSTYDKTIHAEILRKAGGWLEMMAVRSENLSRFATYMEAKEQGMTDKEAAFRAKEITVNFNRKGRISGLMGSLFAFFNASVQGGENIIRLGKEHSGKFFAIGAAGMAMGFMTALLNSLWGDDDEDGLSNYDNINDYIKFNNLVIMVPGLEKYLSIPLPHGFRWFNSLGVLAYQLAFTDDKTILKAGKDGLSNAFSSISPVNPVEFLNDEGSITIRPVVPTGAVPFYDIAVNQKFTGAPVHKEPFTQALNGRIANSALGMKNVNSLVKGFTDFLFKIGGGNPETGAKYYENSDGKIVPVSNIFDKNPSDIEHLIEYYLGGRGMFWNDLLKTSQNIIESSNQVMNEDESFGKVMKDFDVNEFPVLKSLVRQPWKKSVYTRYYDVVNDIENYKSMINMKNKSLDLEQEPEAFTPEYAYKIDLLKDLKKELRSIDEDLEGITNPKQIQELKDVQELLIRNFLDAATKYNNQ